MSAATTTLIALALGTYALKAVAPLALGGRQLDRRIGRLVDLLPTAMLAALAVVGAVSAGDRLVLDARAAGVGVAALGLRFRLPFAVVVVLAAVTTASVRAAMA